MHLTKLFNKKYFIQNILKSKAVMALVIGIVPILNAIFMLVISKDENVISVPTLTSISVLNIIGLYILPVVVSLCLFGYVFKKKSVDFINSMPLTRKTIYITNAIGGVIILTVMMLINALLLGLETIIFSSLVIPFAMIVDYFIVWAVAYIFVFSAATLATSISGNMVTMLITTAVILLFIPFMYSYITGFDGNIGGRVYYTTDCMVESQDCLDMNFNSPSITKVEKSVSYTLPYNYISLLYGNDITTYSVEAIVKMLILSIIYFVVGLALFEKRKMEANETSFKSTNMHMILKSLTAIPLFAFALMIIDESSNSITTIVFSIALMVAYYLIYDLITVRSIRKFKIGVIYFLAFLALSTVLYQGIVAFNERRRSVNGLDLKRINGISTYISNVDYLRQKDSALYNVYIEDNELIDFVRNVIKDSTQSRNNKSSMSASIKLRLDNNQEYKIYLNMTEEEYNYFKNLVFKDKKYVETYKNMPYSEIVSVNIENMNFVGKQKDEIVYEIKKSIDNVDLNTLRLNYSSMKIVLNVYQNHEMVEYSIPIDINSNLYDKYLKIANAKFKEALKKVTQDDILWVDIFSYLSLNQEETSEKVNDLYNYIENATFKKILYEYAKEHAEDEIDSAKDVIRITFRINNSNIYRLPFYTNDLDGIIKLLEPLKVKEQKEELV